MKANEEFETYKKTYKGPKVDESNQKEESSTATTAPAATEAILEETKENAEIKIEDFLGDDSVLSPEEYQAYLETLKMNGIVE